MGGEAWELGNVKNWAGDVQPARPFIQPAIDDMSDEYEKIFIDAIEKAVS